MTIQKVNDRSDKAREVSKRPRPNGVSPVRAKIIALMSKNKPVCKDFKTFMAMWEKGQLAGPTIETVDHKDSYVITDGNENTSYAWGTLEKMYSSA